MEIIGEVSSEKISGVATVTFSHPKSNSLPKKLLIDLAAEISRISHESDVSVVLLKSGGEGAFCAGASFEELSSLSNLDEATEFFMGFAKVMMALISSPVPTVVRVHGKVVGGGVGLVAACDYSIASETASARLSELSIGIGPFVIGPVVRHRIGQTRFSTMALGGEWKDPKWCEAAGLYSEIVPGKIVDLDTRVSLVVSSLAKSSRNSVTALKESLWRDAFFTESKFHECAALSGKLSLEEYCRRKVACAPSR